MLCLITCKVRSENGYGFLRPGLKTGVENGISWSEIGSNISFEIDHGVLSFNASDLSLTLR